MAVNLVRIITALLVGGLIWVVLIPWLGVGGGIAVALAFTAGIMLLIDRFLGVKIFPFPLAPNIAMYAGIFLLGIGIVMGGVWTKFTGGATTASIGSPPQVTTTTSTSSSGCTPSAELKDKDSTITLNTYDYSSNTPTSTEVDLGATCFLYRTNPTTGALTFIKATSDTTANTITGASVGDVVSMYCTTNTYYTEPVVSKCLLKQSENIDLKTYQLVSNSSLQQTGYDNTGATTLNACPTANANCDYNLTLGSGQVDTIYVRNRVNIANRAYNFCGWATATFFNITEAKPVNEGSSVYAKTPSRLFLKNINVVTVTAVAMATNSTVNKDYTPYVLSTPIRLNQFESVKTQFQITATSGSDPIDQSNTTNFNGVAIVPLDCGYAKGSDNLPYLDFYVHDQGEVQVGVGETLASPQGRDAGILLNVI